MGILFEVLRIPMKFWSLWHLNNVYFTNECFSQILTQNLMYFENNVSNVENFAMMSHFNTKPTNESFSQILTQNLLNLQNSVSNVENFAMMSKFQCKKNLISECV